MLHLQANFVKTLPEPARCVSVVFVGGRS